jgi:hypothetical protein
VSLRIALVLAVVGHGMARADEHLGNVYAFDVGLTYLNAWGLSYLGAEPSLVVGRETPRGRVAFVARALAARSLHGVLVVDMHAGLFAEGRSGRVAVGGSLTSSLLVLPSGHEYISFDIATGPEMHFTVDVARLPRGQTIYTGLRGGIDLYPLSLIFGDGHSVTLPVIAQLTLYVGVRS